MFWSGHVALVCVILSNGQFQDNFDEINENSGDKQRNSVPGHTHQPTAAKPKFRRGGHTSQGVAN